MNVSGPLTRCGAGANPSVPSVLAMTTPRLAARSRRFGAVALAVAAMAAGGCGGKSTSTAPAASGGSATPGATTGTNPSAPAGSASPSVGGVPSQAPAPVESNPPGDIPDNVAYVGYHNATGRYTFVHPEGWASTARGATVTFTDKLNGISATGRAAAAPVTVSSAKQDVAQLRTSQAAFELRSMKPVTLPGGAGVLVVFRRNSASDPVTGKVFRDEVNRYEIAKGGREVVLDLYGPVGSDNVDPYTKISESLRLA